MIVDRGLGYSFKLKKNERSYTLYVYRRDRKYAKVRLSIDFNQQQLTNALREIGRRLEDEILVTIPDQLAEKLMDIFSRWSDLIELAEIPEAEALGEEVLMTVSHDGTEFMVMSGEILTMPVHGGFIWLGNGKYAVAETTFAYGRYRGVSEKGEPIEIEDVFPIVFVAEYDGGTIANRKVYIIDRKRKISVFEKPVKIIYTTEISTVLPTFMKSVTGKKFLEGAISKPFSEIYPKVLEYVKKYVNLEWDKRLYHIVASYIMATYFYDVFSAFPRLYLYGSYGAGKTRLGVTMAVASYHGATYLSPSESSIFRSIDTLGATIYIDESELEKNIMKILASGYKRSVPVARIEKERKNRFQIAFFEAYSPVIMGYTEIPSELILQRTILITMRKAPDPSPERKEPHPKEFDPIREQLYLARLTRMNEVLEAMEKVREDIKKTFTGREFELWFPLLTIAYLCGSEAYEKVKSYAIEDIENRKETLYSVERLILEGIERIISRTFQNEYRFTASQLSEEIKEILIELGEYEEKSFNKEFNPKRLGKILTKMGVRSERTKHERVRIISRKEFYELARRYYYESDFVGTLAKEFTSEISSDNERNGSIKNERQPAEGNMSEEGGTYIEVDQTKSDSLSECSESGVRFKKRSGGTAKENEEDSIKSAEQLKYSDQEGLTSVEVRKSNSGIMGDKKGDVLPIGDKYISFTPDDKSITSNVSDAKESRLGLPTFEINPFNNENPLSHSQTPEKTSPLSPLSPFKSSCPLVRKSKQQGLEILKEKAETSPLRKMSLTEAILKLLSEKSMSDIELYQKLTEMQRKRQLREGTIVNYETIMNILNELEYRGVVARTWDERYGTEKYFVTK